MKYKIIIGLCIFLAIAYAVKGGTYVAPSYDSINLSFETSYTAPSYTSVPLIFGEEDTCSCPGLNQNWEINMEDNCTICTECNLGTGILNFTNAGYVIINTTINASDIGYIYPAQTIYMTSISTIYVG